MSTLTTTQTKVLTDAILKGILSDALVPRGTAVDLDTTTTAGIYYINPTTANQPLQKAVYGALILARISDFTVQIVISWSNGTPMFYRINSSTIQQPWRQITTTAAS